MHVRRRRHCSAQGRRAVRRATWRRRDNRRSPVRNVTNDLKTTPARPSATQRTSLLASRRLDKLERQRDDDDAVGRCCCGRSASVTASQRRPSAATRTPHPTNGAAPIRGSTCDAGAPLFADRVATCRRTAASAAALGDAWSSRVATGGVGGHLRQWPTPKVHPRSEALATPLDAFTAARAKDAERGSLALQKRVSKSASKRSPSATRRGRMETAPKNADAVDSKRSKTNSPAAQRGSLSACPYKHWRSVRGPAINCDPAYAEEDDNRSENKDCPRREENSHRQSDHASQWHGENPAVQPADVVSGRSG